MSLLERLADTVASLLDEDPRRVLLGEDVRDGGMLGLSRVAAQNDAHANRLLGTPLTPTVSFAHAAGLALSGARPIMLLHSAGALVDGLAGLREAAQIGWRSGGQLDVPLLIVAPTGPGFGLGGEAAESPEALLTAIPGLRVIVGGRADEISALMRAAASFEDGIAPTVLLLPRSLLLTDVEEESRELGRPVVSSRRVASGDAATVFAWGAAVDAAVDAAAASGHAVTVIDVGSLAPLDVDALVSAASETGKIVIAHAGPRNNGVGAELAALFADDAILHLDAPVVRVCGTAGHPTPGTESSAAPSVDEITHAIRRVAEY